MKRFTVLSSGLGLLALASCAAPASDKEEVAFFSVSQPVPGSYIVVLQDEVVSGTSVNSLSEALAIDHGPLAVSRQYNTALKGFAASMDEATAMRLAGDNRVKFVEENGIVEANDTQENATWGLDRIDQNLLPLDTTYTYNARGNGVTAYIIDTGLRITHSEFGGRAQHGFDSIGDGQNGNDCNGHGTHVGGTVGGTTWGVAKNVELRTVRVLDCNGSGTWEGVIAGIDWVTQNGTRPAVANMSLGGGVSAAVNQAVANSVAAGFVYAVAGGNESTDACSRSPASTPTAITVGATTITDARASFSNFGTCLDIFAPGQDITSSWIGSDSATNTISGTSMATPHVAGAVALYLEVHPLATPADVVADLAGNGSAGVVTSPGTGSPNIMLYSGFINGGGGEQNPPVVSITAPADGTMVSGVVNITVDATDDTAVRRVNLIVDGAQVATDDTAPYEFTWDSDLASNGSHTIDARAFDVNGNSASDSITVSVMRAGGAEFDATLRMPACRTSGRLCDTDTLVIGRASLGPEQNTPNTFAGSCPDGTSGSYLSDESVERVRVFTNDGSPLAPGANVSVEVTVFAWSTGTSDTLDIFHAADANNPSWTFVQSIVPSAGGIQRLTSTFTLPAGTLQAFRAQFRYQGSAVPCSTGSYDDRDDIAFDTTGNSMPVDTTPPTVTITDPLPNQELTAPFDVRVSASDNVGVSSVELFIDSVSVGIAETAPYDFFDVGAGLAVGPHTIQAVARDEAGNSASAQVSVTVSDPSRAIYDSTLGAPVCNSATAVCDTNAILNGRGTRGPEMNAPNTLDTCNDGNSGTYLSDESIERIRIFTADGMPIRAGSTVTVEVTVYVWSSGSSDSLDLYQSTSATSPTWTFIRTLRPSGGGIRTLSTTFTVASGTNDLRGLRARFRYLGSRAACGTGSYDDHDDLAFRLAP